MKLRAKFNLVFVAIFLLGFALSGVISYSLLQANARQEVVRNAELMLATALAIRGYTIDQVKPHLELQLMRAFLPQSVPAYAATETMSALRKSYPEYGYKEATLNPTNPRNRAADWEADIVQEFRNNQDRSEIVGTRDTPTGPSVFIARPIRITNEACLSCHSVPGAAPEPMRALYGDANGFGWRLNEVIGAQIVSVPAAIPIENANRAFATFMGSLSAVFLGVFLTLNWMLGRLIVRPLAAMAEAADRISTGTFDIPEFSTKQKDEIGVLGQSFNRLRRSLEKAMQMLEG